MKPKFRDLYMVKWRDHFTTEGFTPITDPEMHSEVIITSVGFFIRSEKYYHCFAQSIDEHTCDNIISILKNNIVFIARLDNPEDAITITMEKLPE